MGRRLAIDIAVVTALLGAAACGVGRGDAEILSQDTGEPDASNGSSSSGGATKDPASDAGDPSDGALGDVVVDGASDAAFDAGPEPPTLLSPYAPAGELTYQRNLDWTIAALDPATVIHYTTNGASPLAAGANSATGRVTIANVANNTTIQWSAGASTVVHSFVVKVNGALSASTQTFVDRVSFDPSGSPFAKVAAGATVTGHARYFMWNASSGCPNCIDQILVGITMSEDCIADENPMTYPGTSDTNATFTFKAPMTPGTYKVKTGFRQEYVCAPDAINKALGTTEIGTIVVE